MINLLKRTSIAMSAAMTVGLMTGVEEAHAGAGGQDFSTIAENMIISIENLPGLLSGLSYMFGILLGVLGVLKIKDHVENPSQTPIKDGAVRLAAGGALFALPMVYEAMQTTIGDGAGVSGPTLDRVTFGVGGS